MNRDRVPLIIGLVSAIGVWLFFGAYDRLYCTDVVFLFDILFYYIGWLLVYGSPLLLAAALLSGYRTVRREMSRWHPLVYLGIALAIAGLIASMWFLWSGGSLVTGDCSGGVTQKVLEVTSGNCTPTGVVINLRNSGAKNITLLDGGEDTTVTKQVISGNASSAESWTYYPTTAILTPGSVGYIMDADCNSRINGESVCSYVVIAGGRPSVVQVTC